LRLRVIDDIAHHPLRRALDKGLMVSVNSDDPAYFGGYVNDNYWAVANGLSLSGDEIVAIVRNGVESSLMTRPVKDQTLAEIDRVLAASN
jgi:adenosine deaminase